MEHGKVASAVLDALGGAANIQAAAHCATRLRIVPVDKTKIDQKALDAHPDVKGTFEAGGQFQIIIGPGDVDHVYEALISQAGIKEASKDDVKQIAGQQGNIVVRFIKTLSDIFVPILPALIAGGLLMALNNVLTAEGLFGAQSVIEMQPWLTDIASLINMIASAAFAFLPILVGFSAAKRFGANPYLGATMGAAMVMPALVNGYDVSEAIHNGTMTYWHIFGIDVAQAGYQGSVIPILAVTYILSVIEKNLHKILKGTFDFLFTPMITLLVTGLITFIAVGPLMRLVSDGITSGIEWLYSSTWIFGGAIFGAVYSPIVVTGLHQSFPAVELNLIAQGGSFIFPIASMANIAQGAACLAIFVSLRTGSKLRAMAGASSLSALLGITEPAIFGVNLRLQFPFFIALGSAAVAGAFISLFQVVAVALGAAGVIGFVSIKASFIPAFALCALISFVLSFGTTLIYTRWKVSRGYVLDPADVEASLDAAAGARTETNSTDSQPVGDLTVTAPMAGTLTPLSEVNDPMFANAVLGPGVAIRPDSGVIVSPVDGTVTAVFPTGHAYGITTQEGAEILVHIGLDTVKLGGTFFTAHVAAGDIIHRGDLLVVVDLDGISAAGYDTTTPIVVTNVQRFGRVQTAAAAGRTVASGDAILTLTSATEAIADSPVEAARA